jgi:hypothetical protein
VGLETPEMSENNIPHVVDTGASIMRHEKIQPGYIGNVAEMGFTLQLPKKVGCWVIGGNFSIYVEEKATDAQIKATEEMFGWKWKDGDMYSHLNK